MEGLCLEEAPMLPANVQCAPGYVSCLSLDFLSPEICGTFPIVTRSRFVPFGGKIDRHVNLLYVCHDGFNG
jgi:hypothetical protein